MLIHKNQMDHDVLLDKVLVLHSLLHGPSLHHKHLEELYEPLFHSVQNHCLHQSLQYHLMFHQASGFARFLGVHVALIVILAIGAILNIVFAEVLMFVIEMSVKT